MSEYEPKLNPDLACAVECGAVPMLSFVEPAHFRPVPGLLLFKRIEDVEQSQVIARNVIKCLFSEPEIGFLIVSGSTL